ncbi:hypothetical protein LPB67_03950 [Undibacterium sp. Jales W-56]|uniref:STY0301 family protein n=1 Tax=Undibacterium sp. Jales W-56 TaxID=2897325 RepID=UPI0021CFFC8A|nr:STY0301 family protein [Undibacterium sp. Jales W-56]MCU6432929.1 hypothetical protein [Undibacterium sp. Jales W-56]
MLLPQIKSILFFVLIAPSYLAFAVNAVPACPSELQVEQTVSKLPEGWTGYSTNKKHRFVNVMFSNGDPTQSFILVPSKELKRNKEDIAIWRFEPSEKAYWISCIYSETKATLARELPDNIKICTVAYDARFTSPVVKEIKCE